MSSLDRYCWFCHEICRNRLGCSRCLRNYHFDCVNKRLLIPDVGGLKKFRTFCQSCISTEEDGKRWRKSPFLVRITKKRLNKILKFMFEMFRKGAPIAFHWPVSKFRDVFKLMTVDIIENKFLNDKYESPRDLLNDIYLINHNCLIMQKYHSTYRTDKPTLAQLATYFAEHKKFISDIETKIRYLEDCPHCVSNYFDCPQLWLTMVCTWGHPLIIVKLELEEHGLTYIPAKLIRYNRGSGRVDVILMGFEERRRVDADACFLPCASDFLSNHKDFEQLATARIQATDYISNVEKEFKIKINFDKVRRKLSPFDKDYINMPDNSDAPEDIIDLTDDRAVVAEINDEEENQSQNLNQDQNNENEDIVISSSSDAKSDEKNDSGSGESDKTMDAVPDKVSGLDDTAKTESLLTTVIERINSPLPCQTDSLDVTIQVPQPPPQVTTSQPSTSSKSTLQMSIPEPMPSKHDPSLSSSSSISTPIPETPEAPYSFPNLTYPSTPKPTPSIAPSISERFAIVSDEEFDTQTDSMDVEPEKDEKIVVKSDSFYPSPVFVVEHGSNLSPQTLDIPPCVLAIEDSKDKLLTFDSQLFQNDAKSFFNLHLSSSDPNSPMEDYPSELSSVSFYVPQQKKKKLDHEIMNTSQSFKIQRLEYQLEFAEKEKQLHLQQIGELQDQLKALTSIEEDKIKSLDAKYLSQITKLEAALETEKGEKITYKDHYLKSVQESAQKVKEVELFWQKKSTEELKSKDEQYEAELATKKEEEASLRAQLEASEERFKILDQKYKALLQMFKNFQSKITELAEETAKVV